VPDAGRPWGKDISVKDNAAREQMGVTKVIALFGPIARMQPGISSFGMLRGNNGRIVTLNSSFLKGWFWNSFAPDPVTFQRYPTLWDWRVFPEVTFVIPGE
jgi:hypothetical protein